MYLFIYNQNFIGRHLQIDQRIILYQRNIGLLKAD